MTLEELIKILNKKYSSSRGFMGVITDTVSSKEDLIENVKDEIVSTEINLDGGYEEDLFGMTTREARGYVKKLKNFVEKYGSEEVK